MISSPALYYEVHSNSLLCSNYVNPETRVPLLVGISCATGGVMLIFMGIRLYTRRVMSKRGLGVDDWMMLLATVRFRYNDYAATAYTYRSSPWPSWSLSAYAQDTALDITTGIFDQNGIHHGVKPRFVRTSPLCSLQHSRRYEWIDGCSSSTAPAN